MENEIYFNLIKKVEGFFYGENENYNISYNCLLLCQNFIDRLYYVPSSVILTGRESVEFWFKNKKDFLQIEIFDNRYEIFSSRDNDKKSILLDENELYEVINIVKIFFNGVPKFSVLFSGAFNPPHIGHQGMIFSALKQGFDYVIFAASNNNFVTKKMKKCNSKLIFSEQERLDMLLAMTYNIPNVLIYGIEKGYTYEVLSSVKEKYNINNLFFALGSDKLNEISSWGFHDKLLVEFGFFVLSRNNDFFFTVDEKCKLLFEKYILSDEINEYGDISSTLIRDKIEKHESFDEFVSPEVCKLLKKNSL